LGTKESVYRKIFASLFIPDGSPEEYDSFEELQRYSCSPTNARRFMKVFFDLDVTDSLAGIRVPTLVIHCRGDCEVPVAESERIARAIPDAKLVVLDGNRHIMSDRGPAWRKFLQELDDFLKPN
jgi:pimeloyl-ACP methyl ester carboxylesterase